MATITPEDVVKLTKPTDGMYLYPICTQLTFLQTLHPSIFRLQPCTLSTCHSKNSTHSFEGCFLNSSDLFCVYGSIIFHHNFTAQHSINIHDITVPSFLPSFIHSLLLAFFLSRVSLSSQRKYIRIRVHEIHHHRLS